MLKSSFLYAIFEISISVAQAVVAGHAFVVATPQESKQVDIVPAGFPQAVGQSGEQVTASEATQILVDVTVHAADPS